MKKLSTKSGFLTLILFGAILATGCVTVDGGGDGMVKVEFEAGEWEGNIVMNAQPDNPENDGEIGAASGDFFYMQDSGLMTVSFEVPEAGDYVVKIYYAIPTSYGDKQNNVFINGEDIGAQAFAQTGGEWTAKWIQATLQAGQNSVGVGHNWGYTWFDYVTVESLM